MSILRVIKSACKVDILLISCLQASYWSLGTMAEAVTNHCTYQETSQRLSQSDKSDIPGYLNRKTQLRTANHFI